jgi:hypothetical protein
MIQTAKQLLLLTLALEQALETDNATEFDALLQSRQELLDGMTSAVNPLELRQVQSVEDRMIRNARRVSSSRRAGPRQPMAPSRIGRD